MKVTVAESDIVQADPYLFDFWPHHGEQSQDFTVMANCDRTMSDELPCYRCGYDLRAHPQDGICPECGGSVSESRRWAAIPRRPAWKDSDARWRRRMLAGVWVLVLLPLVDVLQKFGWASLLPVPNFWGYGPVTLNDTCLWTLGVYPPILFCIGAVLLFSKERGRRSSRLDWTRRWGIICSYVVMPLTAALKLFMPALVLTGISAVFMSMPLKNQPSVTRLFVELSTRYLRYGPYPKDISYYVLVTFSSITILLACVPLWEALCSSGLKRVAKILLVPLALFSLANIAQAGLVTLGLSRLSGADPSFSLLGPYFRPALLVWNTTGYNSLLFIPLQPALNLFVVEAAKWCIILAIAVGLSIAQLAARQKNRKSVTVERPPVAQ
jgi:hypothetical protein